jgi:hypothetical protein
MTIVRKILQIIFMQNILWNQNGFTFQFTSSVGIKYKSSYQDWCIFFNNVSLENCSEVSYRNVETIKYNADDVQPLAQPRRRKLN